MRRSPYSGSFSASSLRSHQSDSAPFSRTDDRRHHLFFLSSSSSSSVARFPPSSPPKATCPSTRTCLTTGHPHPDTDPRPHPPARRTVRAQDDRVAAAVTEAQAPGMVSMAGHRVDTAVRPEAVMVDAGVTAVVVADTAVAGTTGRATSRSRPRVPSP